MSRDDNKKKIIEGGAAIVGSGIGAAAGTALGGPMGTVAGAAAGSAIGTGVEKIISFVSTEMLSRRLSKMEEKRTEVTIDLLREKISQNLSSGEQYRSDDFFDKKDNVESPAEELLEGTILSVQREYQEKKLPYVSNFYANLVFAERISPEEANQLLKIIDSLSYRQLVILKVIALYTIDESKLPKRITSFNDGIQGYDNISIATEIYDLYRKGLVFSNNIILDVAGINPSALSINGCGAELFNLMELGKLSEPITEGRIVAFLIGQNVVGDTSDNSVQHGSISELQWKSL